MTGGRYPVLRALGILYVVGAGVAVLIGLYWAGWSLVAAPASASERIGLALAVLAATFFAVVTVLAIAEGIKLVIDVERNTRIAAVNAAGNNGVAVASPMPTVTAASGHVNRVSDLDEESAEAALLRGH